MLPQKKKKHKQIPSLTTKFREHFVNDQSSRAQTRSSQRLRVQFGSQWSRTSSAISSRSHLTKACYSFSHPFGNFSFSFFFYRKGVFLFGHPSCVFFFFFLEKNYQNHATTISFPWDKNQLVLLTFDSSLGAGWEFFLEVRSAWAFFLFFFLGTAILFEPLTARLVDLDQ